MLRQAKEPYHPPQRKTTRTLILTLLSRRQDGKMERWNASAFLQRLKPHPVYTPNLQIFAQSIIEGFIYTNVGVFAGFITGTVIIIAFRLQNLSKPMSNSEPPYDAFLVCAGFVLGSVLSGHHGLRKFSQKYDLSQIRSYQLEISLASIFLIAAAFSTAFLRLDIDNIESSASFSISVLLSVWSGFSFSPIKLLNVPDLPLPICTGSINTLFYDRLRHDEYGWSIAFRRMSLVLAIFAGALTGAGSARPKQWTPLLVAIGVTVVSLILAEYIERGRLKETQDRRAAVQESYSQS